MMMMRGLLFVLLVALGAVAAECPRNCTSAQRGTCDVATGVCDCRCNHQYHCYAGDACQKDRDPVWDWDSLDCHDGYWTGNWTEPQDGSRALREIPWFVRACSCPATWTGADCSICVSDESCRAENDLYDASPNATCDRSIYIFTDKHYFCNVTTPELAVLLQSNASVALRYRFPPPELTNFTAARIGNASIVVYNRQTGPPMVFSCELTFCEVAYQHDGSETIVCPKAKCACTSWCADFVAEIVNQMVSTSTLRCNVNGTCTFFQEELSAFVPFLGLQCFTGECLNTSYTPIIPPKPILSEQMVIILSVLGGVIAGTAVITLLLFAEHRHIKKIPWIEAQDRQPANLVFERLSCTIREFLPGASGKKRWVLRKILDNASGQASAGQILAVLGSSGAGKTTFLDILTGRKNTGFVTGSIYANGQPFWKLKRRAVGYVMQEDTFLSTLTVREHLQYTALLRLPQSMPYSTKMARVEELLRDMGLAEVASTRIGSVDKRGISGGERKRLSIASELVVKPQILVLDEPTSGLDAHGAFKVVSLVKHIAQQTGCTVVLSIHQPRSNIFAMFDNLLLLAHGKAVYSGPASGAVAHLERHGYQCPEHFNPADFLIDTVHSREVVENLMRPLPVGTVEFSEAPEEAAPSSAAAPEEEKAQLLSAATTPDVTVTVTPEPGETSRLEAQKLLGLPSADEAEYVTSYATQLYYICKRTLVNVIRNPALLRMNYSLVLVVSLLMGGLYFKMSNDLAHGGIQNRMGMLFFIVCLLSFIAITSIDTFFTERAIFVRERANSCYRTSTYYFGKILCDFLPQRIIPPLVLGSVVYWMSGLRSDTLDHFALFLVIIVLLSLASAALCMVISCFAPSVAVGNLIAILTLFFSLLFGGFLVMKSGMKPWLHWICLLSIFNYSFEALMINELNGIWVEFNPAGHSITPINGKELLINMGMNVNDLSFDVAMLGVVTGVFIIAGYILLRFFVKERR